MKFFLAVFAAFLVVFSSCTEQQEPGAPEKQDTASRDTVAVKTPFFPVASYIASEIKYVDSLPVGIVKYTTIGKKTDSAYITPEDFHRLAGEFLGDELREPQFSKKFTESSFFDRSANTATFFYKSADPGTAISRVDIITAKGEVYDEVKSIYMEKANKRLFWKPKRNFQIISMGEKGSPGAVVTKVVWDNRE